jgi:hypothetical protein
VGLLVEIVSGRALEGVFIDAVFSTLSKGGRDVVGNLSVSRWPAVSLVLQDLVLLVSPFSWVDPNPVGERAIQCWILLYLLYTANSTVLTCERWASLCLVDQERLVGALLSNTILCRLFGDKYGGNTATIGNMRRLFLCL